MSDLEKAEIFKIQLPIVTNAPTQLALIYNEKRNICGQIPVTDELADIFDGELKIYVKGQYNNKTGKVHIGKKTKDQSW